MPVEIVKTVTVEAPSDVAFDYVADYRNVPEWLFGVHDFDPAGEKDYGLGAAFDASMHLGVHLKSRIEVTSWVQGRLIGFDSRKGFKVTSRWLFEPLADRRTEITAEVGYTLPFGPAGKAMDRVIGPMVRQAVARSSEQLKVHIEAAAQRQA